MQKPVNELLSGISNIHLIAPQDYLPFVYLMNHKEQDQSNKKILSKSNQNFDENTLSDLKLSPQEEITKLKAELKEKQEQINILQKENASNYSKLEYHYKQKRTFNSKV